MRPEIEKLMDGLKDVVKDSFERYFQLSDVSITPQPGKPGTVQSSHLVLNLIFGSEVSVQVKVHYQNESFEDVVVKRFGNLTGDALTEKMGSLVKEYVNVFSGELKHLLDTSGLRCGQGIPVRLSGFDEIILGHTREASDQQQWVLDFQTGSCVLEIETLLKAESAIQKLGQINLSKAAESDGEIEFF